jgi:hypothetical protein
VPVELGERPTLSLDIGQRLFIGALEAAGDQPGLRFARVELPTAPLRLILRALHGQQLKVPALRVVGLELIAAAAVASTPAGMMASRNASTIVRSNRSPPIDWQRRLVACVW